MLRQMNGYYLLELGPRTPLTPFTPATNTQDPVTRVEATRSSVQVAHDLFEEYTDSDLKEVRVYSRRVDFGLKTVGEFW